jgi:hypothetical protein
MNSVIGMDRFSVTATATYKYARRQWHLVDDPGLKYQFLARFDREMLGLAGRSRY